MMKLVITGYKEDINAFNEMLNNMPVCPFINNEDVSCCSGLTCKQCVLTHIDFKEKKRKEKKKEV